MVKFGKYGWGVAGCCLTAGLATACGEAQDQTKKMNILFIMSDDHAYQAISSCGGQLLETPNIDRIAHDGVVFTNSFVANSISGPSRACMLTGKHSHVNGFRNNEDTFDGSQPTYPSILQKEGYQTAMIGKWHLASRPQGFDHWDILIGQGDYYNPDFICDGDTIRREGYVTDLTADLALEWLDKRDPKRPFCLLMHNKAPHRIWMPAIEDLGAFDKVKFPVPETFYDDYATRRAASLQEMSIDKDMDLIYDLKIDPKMTESRNKWLTQWAKNSVDRMSQEDRKAWDAYYDARSKEFAELNLKGRALAEWKLQCYLKDYVSVIRSVDRNVGRVLDYLKKEGLDQNTLVVYTSDQGFYMGEHGFFDKRFMYEESFRTPLVMLLPDGKQGEIHQMVQNIDYAPTFLEAAGVAVPEDMQGLSLMPLLRGEEPDTWRTSLYYHFYEYPGEHAVRRHEGVRNERYKLIRFYGDGEYWEFFDLKEDPHELHNVIDEARYQEQIEEAKAELKRLQKQYNAPEVH